MSASLTIIPLGKQKHVHHYSNKPPCTRPVRRVV
jgi:hypothetical protein